jgi:hypothetical protein
MSLKNNYVKIADKVIDLLEDNGYQADTDTIRHILLMLTFGSYKVKLVNQEFTNEQIAELMLTDIDTTLRAHFGNHTTREIMKAIFVGIVKYKLMGDD